MPHKHKKINPQIGDIIRYEGPNDNSFTFVVIQLDKTYGHYLCFDLDRQDYFYVHNNINSKKYEKLSGQTAPTR